MNLAVMQFMWYAPARPHSSCNLQYNKNEEVFTCECLVLFIMLLIYVCLLLLNSWGSEGRPMIDEFSLWTNRTVWLRFVWFTCYTKGHVLRRDRHSWLMQLGTTSDITGNLNLYTIIILLNTIKSNSFLPLTSLSFFPSFFPSLCFPFIPSFFPYHLIAFIIYPYLTPSIHYIHYITPSIDTRDKEGKDQVINTQLKRRKWQLESERKKQNKEKINEMRR